VRWKEFTAEHDTWERKKDLGNTREVLEEFEGRMNAEVRRQEKIDMAEEKDFRRGELLGKFTVKMLYVLWNTLDLTFYFSFIYFSFDFIFFFLFFSFRTMKKACDFLVT